MHQHTKSSYERLIVSRDRLDKIPTHRHMDTPIQIYTLNFVKEGIKNVCVCETYLCVFAIAVDHQVFHDAVQHTAI